MTKKNLKVLLIALYHGENMAVRLLQPILKQNGHRCEILFFKNIKKQPSKKSLLNRAFNSQYVHEMPSEEDYQAFVDVIQQAKPDIIGINVLSITYKVAAELSRIIRDTSQALIVWGGPHCTVAPEECKDDADYICMGEGVVSFPKLVNTLAEGGDPRDIKGFACMKDGTFTINPPQEHFKDMDALPFVDFSGEGKYYLEDGAVRENARSHFLYGCIDAPYQPVHRIMTAWACPFECTFCINSIEKKKLRRRSVDNVIAELKLVKYRNPYLGLIIFEDDIFTMQPSWIEEFVDKYTRYIDLPFFCHSHFTFTNQAILESLRKAGCLIMSFGIQSGNESTRKIMGRFETNEEIIEAAWRVDRLRKIPYKRFGFQVYYDLIHDNPVESEKDLDGTLDLLCRLPNNFLISIYSLTHFPGYPLTEFLLSQQHITPDDIQGKGYKYDEVTTYYESRHLHEKDERQQVSDFYRIAYHLAQYRFLPRWMIRSLSKPMWWKRFWIKRQNALFGFARFMRGLTVVANINLLVSFIRLVSWTMVRSLKDLTQVDAVIDTRGRNVKLLGEDHAEPIITEFSRENPSS